MAFTMKKGSKDLGHGTDGDISFSNKQHENMGGVTFASPAAKSGILKTDDEISSKVAKAFGDSGKAYQSKKNFAKGGKYSADPADVAARKLARENAKKLQEEKNKNKSIVKIDPAGVE